MGNILRPEGPNFVWALTLMEGSENVRGPHLTKKSGSATDVNVKTRSRNFL